MVRFETPIGMQARREFDDGFGVGINRRGDPQRRPAFKESFPTSDAGSGRES
jgi:hypothetical protein